MLAHLMLNEAGFNSFHAYTNATFRGDAEEHAIAVVRHKGQLWIVDPFHATFHGGKLRDFTSHRGNRRSDDYTVEIENRRYGCRLRMNNFPTYWLPKADLALGTTSPACGRTEPRACGNSHRVGDCRSARGTLHNVVG